MKSIEVAQEVEVAFRITGKRSLMMHNPAGMQAATGGPKGPTRVPTPEVEAEASAYRLPDGRLYIKSEAFRGALLRAASGYKIGKTTARSVVMAGVDFYEEVCPLAHPETGEPITDYVIDIRRAVLDKKVAVMRARARVDAWSCQLNVRYDPEVITAETLLKFMQIAGKQVGVCDQRPGAPKTPGPYGTFTVELIEE